MQRKPNPKYANGALTKDVGVEKPSTYEDASQGAEWRKAMEEEFQKQVDMAANPH